MLRPAIETNAQQDFNKILLRICLNCRATEFKWFCLIRNPRVSFKGHTDSEAIRVDETFVEIHAEDDDDNNFEYEPANRPGTDTDTNTNTDMDMDLMTVDNDWAAQGFEYLNRRPPRSQQPRFTNPNQLSRQSCFF